MQQKYLSLIPTNVLDQSDIGILDKEISLTELHDALKDMKVGAVPGEDGLTVHFSWNFGTKLNSIYIILIFMLSKLVIYH